MVQKFFERSFAINRLRQGPLAGHIDLLAARLETAGYSRIHSRIQLWLVGFFTEVPADFIENGQFRRYPEGFSFWISARFSSALIDPINKG